LKKRTPDDQTKECDDNDLQLYFMFLAKFGSHYVSGVDMGCSVTWTHTASRSDISQIQATVQRMSRMERCTSSKRDTQSERADDEYEYDEEMKERDAKMGQAVEDALGPSRAQENSESASSTSLKSKQKSKKNDDDDDDDDDEEEMEDEEDEDGEDRRRRRRRRRRLLHTTKRSKNHHHRKHHHKRHNDDDEKVDDLKCEDTASKTLIDLGVVNPSLKYAGGDLTLAPKSIESIRDARLEPYLASCMDSPAPIAHQCMFPFSFFVSFCFFSVGCYFFSLSPFSSLFNLPSYIL